MTIYLVPIEPIDTRYTGQWYTHIPNQLRKLGVDVVTIDGDEIPPVPTPGAFLDFAATNVYKSSQLIRIANLIREGQVKNGDYFLFTDAWNPTVIQLKYMTDLLGIKIQIGGMWHAGSYDPYDFLGRVEDKFWIRGAETTMFHCYDQNFFATEFHLKMFLKDLFDETDIDKWKEHYPETHVVGWPMEYLPTLLAPFAGIEKKNKIIFPHRIAPEKQVEIFRDLATTIPGYEWFVAQDHKLTKDEYHTHLAESKIAFSANLQETLGISTYEAACLGTCPLIPSRLSYTEMYTKNIFYPSEWTESWESYQTHKDKLLSLIIFLMSDKFDIAGWARRDAGIVGEKFFNGKELYKIIGRAIGARL